MKAISSNSSEARLEASLSEDAFWAWLSEPARTAEELSNVLQESHPVFANRSETCVAQLRAAGLVAVARQDSVPPPIWDIVREELSLGMHPPMVAAAAHLVANARTLDSDWSTYLNLAKSRFAGADRAAWIIGNPKATSHADSSVLTEIEGALKRVVEREQRVIYPIQLTTRPTRADASDIGSIELEDQDGTLTTFENYFRGRITFLTFFYTRCNNPLKCSANIQSLGKLVSILRSESTTENIQTAAISYDGAYDTPVRLKSYAQTRGLIAGPRDRLFRCPQGLIALQRALKLNVSFGAATVSAHAAEALVIDESLRVAWSLVREGWDIDEVLLNLKRVGH